MFCIKDALTYHDIHLITATLTDRRCYKLRHFTITQVHMCIKCRWQLNLCQVRERHVWCSKSACHCRYLGRTLHLRLLRGDCASLYWVTIDSI
jgi:hypothetical protein